MQSRHEENQETVIQRDWTGLIGYDAHFKRLIALLETGKLPQVLILAGRSGLGKSVFATAMAAAQFCVTRNACSRCGPCAEIKAGIHPDLLWLSGESAASLKVDDASRVQEHLQFLPENGRDSHRVAVIADCERLTEQAANRLLKTLEEPPEHARLILTTSRWDNLLPTIRSRVVVWRVAPPNPDESLAWLRRQRGDGAQDKVLKRALAVAGYAPGLALSLLESDFSQFEARLKRLAQLFHAGEREAALTLAESLMDAEKLTAIDLAQFSEIILNNSYRSRFGMGDLGLTDLEKLSASVTPQAIRHRRELLRTLKALAGRSKIPLNAQLAAEALAFSTRA